MKGGVVIRRRAHKVLRPVLPCGHRRYRVPGGLLYLDLAESPPMLARALRLYERRTHRAIADHLHPGMTFLDVGANKGDFTVFAASLVGPAGRVISVEPEEANFAWLGRSVTESGYTNVELRRAALGAEEGNGTLHMGRRSGLHSMLDGLQDRDEGLQTVPVIRMDELVGPINAVKIDVEGFEEQVLAGAERTLTDPDLRVLFMDLHPQLGADNRRVLRRLTDSGFDLREPSRPYQRLQQPEVRREALAIRG